MSTTSAADVSTETAVVASAPKRRGRPPKIKSDVPVVPKRREPSKWGDVFAAPRTDVIEGVDPGLATQWVHKDDVEKYMQPKVLADGNVGTNWAPYFSDESGKGPRALRSFANQGAQLGTVVRNGDQVLMCIPHEELEKRRAAENFSVEQAKDRLVGGDSRDYDGALTVSDGAKAVLGKATEEYRTTIEDKKGI